MMGTREIPHSAGESAEFRDDVSVRAFGIQVLVLASVIPKSPRFLQRGEGSGV